MNYYVTMWCLRVNIVSIDNNSEFAFYCSAKYVAVNNINMLLVAMDSNIVFHFFLSNYKMFLTDLSDVNVLTAVSCKSLDLFVQF